MKRNVLILLSLLLLAGITYSQVQVKRQQNQQTTQQHTHSQTSEAQRKKESEAKRKREAEARRKREAEAKRKREAEAQRKREAEAQRKREAEAQRKREAEVQRQREAEVKLEGEINGHEYVDLGLPSGLKWATCNVGATTPGESGNYYSWGETSPKKSYTQQNSLIKGQSKSKLRSTGIISSSGNLSGSHDAASVNWGGTWRIPTKAEVEELRVRCSWYWSTFRGHRGYKVYGPNGRFIFIPASGYRVGTSLQLLEEFGSFWSTVVNDYSSSAYCLWFNNSSQACGWYPGYYGLSIRPVSN